MNYKILILFFVTVIISGSLYYYQKGIHPNTIIVKSLGYTSLGWEIVHGQDIVKGKIEKLNYSNDSISYCEISLVGKAIDPDGNYFPYDNFEIEFSIDTIVHNMNCERPYSPQLEVINWWWQNKWLELVAYFLISLISTIMLVVLFKINYPRLKNFFNKFKSQSKHHI